MHLRLAIYISLKGLEKRRKTTSISGTLIQKQIQYLSTYIMNITTHDSSVWLCRFKIAEYLMYRVRSF